MKRISPKQEKRQREWNKVCDQRRELLIAKHGYLPDEWTGRRLQRGEGHHNDRDRNNNTPQNCRIVSGSSHRYITDNNVRNVADLLTGLKLVLEKPIDRPTGIEGMASFHGLQAVPKPGKKER